MTAGELRAGAGPAPREESAASVVRAFFDAAYWDNVAWKKQLGCLEVDQP